MEHQDSSKTVYILVGMPGAGKSTWVGAHVPQPRVVCSADHFFVGADGVYRFEPNKLFLAHKACYSKFKAALHDPSPKNIVVDNTNTKRSFIRPFVEEAKLAGVTNIKIVVIRNGVTPEQAFKRNTHGVPLSTIEKMNQEIDNTLSIGFPEDWNVSVTVV